ncbi:hypothetical protein OC845_004731 [Tilletia horrida]|nr:hypothetical protein OC845_004731 [Tilletia horrida]
MTFNCTSANSTLSSACCGTSASYQAPQYVCTLPDSQVQSCLTNVTKVLGGDNGLACQNITVPDKTGGSKPATRVSKISSWLTAAAVVGLLIPAVSASPVPSAVNQILALRDDSQSCSGFTISSQQDTSTASQQISDTVNCQNSAAPCKIQDSQQHTTSITSSYSATAGFDILGITASVTFGTSYTDEESTTLQETFSVPVNQEGFLTTYSAATLFQGTFTGCPDGDVPGEALVPKVNGVTYQVTLTNQ